MKNFLFRIHKLSLNLPMNIQRIQQVNHINIFLYLNLWYDVKLKELWYKIINLAFRSPWLPEKYVGKMKLKTFFTNSRSKQWHYVLKLYGHFKRHFCWVQISPKIYPREANGNGIVIRQNERQIYGDCVQYRRKNIKYSFPLIEFIF